ncbi:MAG: YdeI/OmpD-associated family protein [Bacteroidetes bacterium]|nr:YdeI/OmpD-associated family protein [Bacteroidota bacterium]
MKHDWTEALDKLQSILNKTQLNVAKKWGIDVYTHKGKNVVGFLGFKNHVALWFHNGIFLKDKYKVLVSADSKTKSLRQWRFTSLDEINEKKILEYVKEAIEAEEKGLKLKPEKFKPVAVPELFAKTLSKNKTLKTAFEKLTPGRQKEYNLYIDEAQQETTKLARIEKIKPMILQGVGLNDKYK